MIKKINQYLLTHYPVIWNLKLAPVVALVAVAQIFLFIISYLTTNNTVEDSNSIFTISYYLIYAGSILAAILIFIFWLIQYNRYNGLKAHYPQSNLSLFVEWLLIFAICSFICFIPNALSLGKTTKLKSAASKQECVDATATLARAKALLPSDRYLFTLDSEQTPIIVGNAKVDRTKFDRNLFSYEEDALTPNNPIEYIGPSFLYYVDYSYDSTRGKDKRVHNWLVNENRDSIEFAIQSFLDLQSKHQLKTNVSLDEWMEIVYNPPLYPYPINAGQEIARNDYSVINHVTDKYVQYNKLNDHYSTILSEYEDNSFQKWYLIISLFIGLVLSTMVFSARFTTGKSWVFAFLANGVIAFAFSLVIGFFSIAGPLAAASPVVYSVLWLLLFILIVYTTTFKVVNNRQKGYSNIYVNIGLWLIPSLIPLAYYIYIYSKYLITADYKVLNDGESAIYPILIITILFTIAIMYPVILLLKKWKALPED